MINITTDSTKTTAPTTTISTTQRQATLSATTIPTVGQSSLSESADENRLQAALEHARRLTQMYGYQRLDVAIAWEAVEELSTARRERLLSPMPSCQSLFERYCAENLCALECRIYDC